MIYVVGSGPAGVSFATALLQKGAQVTLLDTGLELDVSTSSKLPPLQDSGPEKWQPSDLAFMKDSISASVAGIPLKYAYGSDFPYRDPGVEWQLEMQGVETRPSFAQGGLSTVWGAAILPYRNSDLRDWPINEKDLADHYRAIFSFTPLAGRADALEQLFPLHSTQPQFLKRSNQALEFLKDLDTGRGELERQGIFFGESRLAIWAKPDGRFKGCCYCAQCMYGCPYGVIYCSSHTLETLREHPNFTYRNNFALDRV